MQEMIEIKRTWFGKKVARSTAPVPQFTEQMVYRLRDQLEEFVSGMNEADLAAMEEKSWRHFVCRDIFLNIDQTRMQVPILVLGETNFWIIDEDHMRVWVEEELFRNYIKRFYAGTVDDAEISEGLNNAHDETYDHEGDFPLAFNTLTLVIKRRDVPEKINAEPVVVEEVKRPLPTGIADGKLEATICAVKNEYYLKREKPTAEVLTKIRTIVIEAALDSRQTEIVVKAKHNEDGALSTCRTIHVSHAGVEESFDAEFIYHEDSIVIIFPKGYFEGQQFDKLIEADSRTPSGINEHAHADCKTMVMRKYFPNDEFTCAVGCYSVSNRLETNWSITLVAIKGKNNEQV